MDHIIDDCQNLDTTTHNFQRSEPRNKRSALLIEFQQLESFRWGCSRLCFCTLLGVLLLIFVPLVIPSSISNKYIFGSPILPILSSRFGPQPLSPFSLQPVCTSEGRPNEVDFCCRGNLNFYNYSLTPEDFSVEVVGGDGDDILFAKLIGPNVEHFSCFLRRTENTYRCAESHSLSPGKWNVSILIYRRQCTGSLRKASSLQDFIIHWNVSSWDKFLQNVQYPQLDLFAFHWTKSTNVWMNHAPSLCS